MEFVARQGEIDRIRTLLKAREPSIAVVYGRRRIGKTSMIREALSQKSMRALFIEGIDSGTQSEQISLFLLQVSAQLKVAPPEQVPQSWSEAFLFLHRVLGRKKMVIVLDELQWLANYRSTLVDHLKMVWENYLGKVPGRSLILCGSIASFMLAKVVRSSAFYGRVDEVIHVKPFKIHETAKMLPGRGLGELLDAQCLSGGVPKYLALLASGPSIQLALEQEAFRPNGYFVEEYKRVFLSHFGRNAEFNRIVSALAAAPYGLSRTDIAKRAKLDLGGGLTNHLEDLEAAGFIQSHRPVDKPTNSRLLRYILTDAYLRFYHAFIRTKLKQIRSADGGGQQSGLLAAIRQKAAWRSWMGRAFELFCQHHASTIADLLGFSGIEYQTGPWFRRSQGNAPGAQIDLLFDRSDQTLTLCEMKRQTAPIGKGIIAEVERKAQILEQAYPRKTVQRVLIMDGSVTREVENSGYFLRILRSDEILKRSR